jgi:hypothetical protein
VALCRSVAADGTFDADSVLFQVEKAAQENPAEVMKSE